MYSGHCGFCGVGGVIVTISTVILVFTGISAAIVLSIALSSAGVGIIASVATYNFMGPMMWVTGCATSFAGYAVAFMPKSSTRLPLLNLWVLMIFIHTGMVMGYGIVLVRDLAQLYLLHDDLLQIVFSRSEEGSPAEPTILNGLLAPGGRLNGAFSQGSASLILHFAPYPLNLVFFLGMRLDISASIFLVLPVVFMVISFPFVLSIRHYFSSNKSGVVKHREVYRDTALSEFMCAPPPCSKYEGDEYSDEEEDLASTFDGDYSGRESSSCEGSDYESGSEHSSSMASAASKHSDEVQSRRPLIR